MTAPTPDRDAVREEPHEYFGDWIDCWQCDGEGHLESCFEDTCVCINPPCVWSRCDVCRGRGGWHADNPDEAPHD